MGEDRISGLPDNIIDHIFSYLPIKDTGKTSILSRNWRYKWKIVSSLVFDDDFFPPIHDDDDDDQMLRKFVGYIDRILMLHDGLICKFDLSCYLNNLPVEDLDRWILHISRHPIKEFSLRLGGPSSLEYKLIPCFFSCQNLTHLNILFCSLKPPLTFKGFKGLKSLDLTDVSLQQEEFDILVSSCMLEKLSLQYLSGIDQLIINVPNLQQFSFVGPIAKFSLKNTSRLEVFSIFALELRPGDNDKLLKLIGEMPQVEQLSILCNYYEDLDSGVIPRPLQAPCRNLKSLRMAVNFASLEGTSTLVCLLRCAPNLQELVINCSGDVIAINTVLQANHLSRVAIDKSIDNVWQADQWSCPFAHLRRVQMNLFHGFQAEIDFVSFMLLSSNVLEKMTVKVESLHKRYTKMLKQLLLPSKRASAHAEIIFL